ncbi:MAG: discoidin domain-containing protein [Syntrophothermus sp.]
MKSVILFLLLIPCLLFPQDAVKSFTMLTTSPVKYEKTEFDIEVSASFINPFDQKEIALDMILTAPSGRKITLPCYFVSGNATSSAWKARFAAQETGSYSFYFTLSKNGQSSAVSQNGTFTAAASNKDGFLHKNDYWTFKFDSGKLFRGIGENVGWESRSWEDSKYTFDYLLPSISKNGANFFRTWMCPWSLAVEWKKVKDTYRYTNSTAYFNESGVKRMDEMITMAESLNLYAMLALDWHGALITNDWWTLNNYNTANGGPAASPNEFFTLQSAKDKYKNRLRYLVARWGYSTSVGAWEFFNEIDNSAYGGGESLVIPHADITQWHDEMSTYLKSIDPYGHLVTTSVSHRDITGMNALPNLDFNQKHIYKNTSAIPSTIKSYVGSTGKPYVIGEFGFRYEDANPAYNYDFNHDFKRGLWYGLFTSTPILPMSWWWELFDTNKMNYYFSSVREISDQMLESGKGKFEPFIVTAPGVEAYGMKCGEKYFLYMLNNSTTDGLNFSAAFNAPPDMAYEIKRFNVGGNYYSSLGSVISAATGRVTVPALSLNSRIEMVLVITPQILPAGRIISFKADNPNLEVNTGDSCRISWTVSPGSAVTLDGEPVKIADSKIVTPKSTTTYTLIASGESKDTSRVTVYVLSSDKINRAANHDATVSGTTSGSAAFAVDGDTTTAWESGAEVSPWIKIDLGRDYYINNAVIKWGGIYAKSYTFQAQSSTGAMSKVFGVSQGDGGTDNITGIGIYGRYLRLLCTGKSVTDKSIIINELEIYGSSVTAVESKPVRKPLPEEFSLEQNFPNPFNPVTAIKYSLPEDCRVKISVYNLLGKQVAVLADEVQTAGSRQIIFDASRINSGVYFYTINASSLNGKNSFSKVRKMTLIK